MRLSFRLPIAVRGLGLLPILAVTIVLAPLVPVSMNSVRWHGAQTLAVEAGAVVLRTALICRPWLHSWRQIPHSLRQVSLLCLHGLLLVAFVSCGRNPNPFAVQSLLTLAFGVLAADVTAVQVVDQRRMLFFVFALLLAGVLVCGLGFIRLSGASTAIAAGSLHDHQLSGGTSGVHAHGAPARRSVRKWPEH